MKATIKSLLTVLVLFSIILATSCGKDEENGPSYDFIDQNLQGTFDGLTFELKEGVVEETTIEGENLLSFDLYDINEEFTEACDLFGFGDEVNVFFFIPNEVGLYELSLDLSSFSGRTVTILDPSDFTNYIATIGAVEILTITDTEVTGRMDAQVEPGKGINGNFSASFCTVN